MSDLPGGLFIRRDRPKNLQQQQPSSNPSRLGLDKLAQEKARERAAAGGPPPPRALPSKRPLPGSSSGDGEAGDGGDGGGDAGSNAHKWRRPREETPSHAGGVNAGAAQKIKERVHERLKGAGQVFTTTGEAGAGAPTGGGASTGGTGATRTWQPAASPALSRLKRAATGDLGSQPAAKRGRIIRVLALGLGATSTHAS